MLKIFIMIIIIVGFHLFGRYVANPRNMVLYNQIDKIKIKGYSTNIIKNYIGNLIAVIGLIIFSIFYFKITNIIFYIALVLILTWAFIRHVADITEKDIPVIVNGLISGKIRSNNIFMKITLVSMISLTISGLICTNMIYPVLSSVFPSSHVQIEEDDRPLSEIIDEMEKNSESTKTSEELLMEQIENMIN